jgi:uncharacterized protein (TIGR03066 family)
MRVLRWTVVGCLVIGLAGCGPTSTTKPSPSTTKPEPKEASNQEKILGTWEVTQSKGAPPGATVEFTKDGKMKVNYKQDGKEQSMEAMYSVDGNKITSKIKLPGGKEEEDTATIEKLTDTEMAIKDKKGDLDEYKKKK